MKYIVSGCTGHLGLNLVKYLLSAGKTVKAIALPGENTEKLSEHGAEVVYGDVTDRDFVFSQVEQGCVFFHLAGVIDITSGNKDKAIQAWEEALRQTPLHPFFRTELQRLLMEKEGMQPIREVVEFVHSLGDAPKAIATGSAMPGASRTLAAAGLSGLFDVILTPDEVEHGKPAPDMFLRMPNPA